MFYHVLVETTEKIVKNNKNKPIYSLDSTDRDQLLEDIIIPYTKGEEFQCDGHILKKGEITRFLIKSSEVSARKWADIKQRDVMPGILFFYTPEMILTSEDAIDITNEITKEAKSKIGNYTAEKNKTVKTDNQKVFIVHGHDDGIKNEVARFVERMGLTAIILHEQASSGQTIIEKIETNADVGFAIILYTPCDKGAEKESNDLQPRARQNVVFEHGYMIGRLGRKHVCALTKGTVEKPTDISGVVYISMDDKHWTVELAKEMKAAGYAIDMNKLF